MTSTLAFSLPEEQSEFEDACNGARWRSVMHEVDQYCRDQLKYHSPSPVRAKALEEVRQQIQVAIENYFPETI